MVKVEIGRIIGPVFYVEDTVIIDIHAVSLILKSIPTVVSFQEFEGVLYASYETVFEIYSVHFK